MEFGLQIWLRLSLFQNRSKKVRNQIEGKFGQGKYHFSLLADKFAALWRGHRERFCHHPQPALKPESERLALQPFYN